LALFSAPPQLRSRWWRSVADNDNDVRHFITGAKSAHETVVTAYAAGDRRTLTTLLAPEVYERFEAAIRERKDHGETVETRFPSIDATDITAAESRGKMAYITLRSCRSSCQRPATVTARSLRATPLTSPTFPTSGFSPEMYDLRISTGK
jgi:Tim44-like domain